MGMTESEIDVVARQIIADLVAGSLAGRVPGHPGWVDWSDYADLDIDGYEAVVRRIGELAPGLLNGNGGVNVICSDRSHEGRTAMVVQFRRNDDRDIDADEFDFHEGRKWSRGQITMGKLRSKRGKDWPRPYDDMLVDDMPIKDGRSRIELDPTNTRTRRRRSMECPLCGLKVDLREENLYPILDKLVGKGVFEVELAHLARIVSS